MALNELKIAVVGLGYVGLPLAIEFGKKYVTTGYDHSADKINNYKSHIDPNGQINTEQFKLATKLSVSSDAVGLREADVIVVAVPTPVDEFNVPDMTPLVKASTFVGGRMKKGVVVVYESTVYPGATEEVCVPLLEEQSGMRWREDFNVGYSPERVNPGDTERTITRIVKVVSGDTSETLEMIGDLYESIISAGVCRVADIRVAEAAKVIENVQRDLNIALMNELAMVFNVMGIDTAEVLAAAGTKWNFLPFRPGLVGGHCIGVDPYYLTHKAQMLGFSPKVILSGREVNDGMATYVGQQIINKILECGDSASGARVTILGLTFKENCPDLRNSKVVDLISYLDKFGCDVSIHDSIANDKEAKSEYGLTLNEWDDLPPADALVVAVSHKEYLNMSLTELLEKLKPGGIFIDVKSQFPKVDVENRGFSVWRL